jgi:hypothetical protein
MSGRGVRINIHVDYLLDYSIMSSIPNTPIQHLYFEEIEYEKGRSIL